MPSAKNVLRNVDLEVEVAIAPRKCSAHQSGTHAHKIQPGELCLVVTEDRFKKNYCRASSAAVLDRAAGELSKLESKLSALRWQLERAEAPRATKKDAEQGFCNED